MKLRSLLINFALGICSVNAGGMKGFINSLGNSVHHNDAAKFQDQAAGHYTAGGLSIRQTNKSVSLLNIRLPEASGSCGDFDLRFGGLSFIQGKEMVDMLKRVGKGAPTYAFQLALKTMAPQIEGALSELRSRLQEINSLMLSDCRMRQTLMEGILPTGSAMHEQVCKEMGGNHNEDFTGAQERCRQGSEQRKAIEKSKKALPERFVGEYNLVWEVMAKMPRYARAGKAEKERIMSMLGTIVSKEENESYKVTVYEPKIDNRSFLDAHLRGGQTSSLTCGDQKKCMKVTSVEDTIIESEALRNTVMEKINALQVKYVNEEAFNGEEIDFLTDSVNLPIYKYIQVSSASGIHWPLSRSAEYLALVILIHQFDSVATEVIDAVSQLESVQLDTKITGLFKKRIQLARTRLQERLSSIDGREIMALEKYLKGKEQEMRSNFDFEQGVL